MLYILPPMHGSIVAKKDTLELQAADISVMCYYHGVITFSVALHGTCPITGGNYGQVWVHTLFNNSKKTQLSSLKKLTGFSKNQVCSET